MLGVAGSSRGHPSRVTMYHEADWSTHLTIHTPGHQSSAGPHRFHGWPVSKFGRHRHNSQRSQVRAQFLRVDCHGSSQMPRSCSFHATWYTRLSPLFSNPAIVLVVAFLSLLRAVLPLYVLRWIVQRTTRQEFPASLVTTHFVHHPPVVAAALAMADDEMRTIKELDADCEGDIGRAVRFAGIDSESG